MLHTLSYLKSIKDSLSTKAEGVGLGIKDLRNIMSEDCAANIADDLNRYLG